jgi:hypothetical protein
MFPAMNGLLRRNPVVANIPLRATSANLYEGRRGSQVSVDVRSDTFTRTGSRPGHQGGASHFSAGAVKPRKLRFGSRETDKRVAQVLHSMPDAHVRELSRFFRLMMTSRQTPLGYTLFVDKPMSFIEFDEVEEQNLMSGYRLWSHYAKQLPTDNHLFRIQRSNSKDSSPYIFLINKAAFRKTVERNQELFKEILGQGMTPQKLLDDIMRDDSPILKNKLNGSQRLFGLLFGLTPEDVFEERLSKQDYLIPMAHYDNWADNRNYTRVGLPLALLINSRSPGSLSLVRHWKEKQPYFQQLVDAPNYKAFLAVIMRKWADAASYGELSHHKESPREVSKISPLAPSPDSLISG